MKKVKKGYKRLEEVGRSFRLEKVKQVINILQLQGTSNLFQPFSTF